MDAAAAPLASAVRRAAGHAWPLLQSTAAATVAWVIAYQLIDDHVPFFAPIAAVVALNASRGERGLSALRLVLGVFVGIVIGELSVAVLGSGYPSLAVATFAALAAARALSSATLVLNQAAVAAILTVVAADGQAGVQRLIDALIGTAVALVFTQVLFSPEPVGMLRRAQRQALAGLAATLEHTAKLLDPRDDVTSGEGARLAIDVPSTVVDLARARRTTGRSVRRSAVWRRQLGLVEQEQARASRIDLLAASSLMLCRAALALDARARARFAGPFRRFSAVLAELAGDPADLGVRQRAADEALAVVRGPLAAPASVDRPDAAAPDAAAVTAAGSSPRTSSP